MHPSKIVLPVAMLALLGSAVSSHAQCTANYTAISAIQGDADVSPLLGQTVQTQGIVTAKLYPGSKAEGFTLSALPGEAAAAIFITNANGAMAVEAGQHIQLSGVVTELQQLTSLTAASALQHCQPSPALSVRQLTLPLPDGISWEQLEGQWLSFNQTLVVTDSYDLPRYGEVTLAATRQWVPTDIMAPGKAAYALYQQQQQQMLVLDDGSWQQNPDPIRYPGSGLSAVNTLRIGDSVAPLQGVLLQDDRGYRLLPTSKVTFNASNPRPEQPAAKPASALRIASFNVLNYFNGGNSANAFPTKRGASSPAEFSRQQAKTIAALVSLDADVIGLLEVENNGFDDNSAIASLTQALNAVSADNPYQYVRTSVQPGNDAIMVAMLYRPRTVTPTGKTAINLAAPFDRGSRPPLAQSFRHLASDELVTVSINHFKSKGSCPKDPQSADADRHDGQGCWNATRVTTAKALTKWLNSQPTGVTTDKQLILGDLNAYRMEDPITTLQQDGWQYLSGSAEPAYSFVFRGRSGSLDHALASPALAKQLKQLQHWSINADEPAALDYNTEHKSDKLQQQLYAPTPYRSSDHDPLISTFEF